MGLIEDYALPAHLAHVLKIAAHGAVGGNHEVGCGSSLGEVLTARAAGTVLHHDFEIWDEALGLAGPVAHHGRWCHHERGAGLLTAVLLYREEGQ